MQKKKKKKLNKFDQIIFIIQYRNFQYRDVQVPRCPDTFPERIRNRKVNCTNNKLF